MMKTLRNLIIGVALLMTGMIVVSGCSAYGNAVARELALVGAQQAVVSGVRNSIEGPQGTTVVVQNGQPQGQNASLRYYDGKMINGAHYKGYLLNNIPHGLGECTTNKMKYVGQFKNGTFDGQGTSTYLGGSKYVGQFKNGMFDGQGTFTTSDGTQLIGQFKDGNYQEVQETTVNVTPGINNATQQSSQQKYYKGKLTDGSHYEGGMLNNFPDGFGTRIWQDGRRYIGEFVDGHFNGQGTLTLPNGIK